MIHDLLAFGMPISTMFALFFRWRWKLAESSRDRWRRLAWSCADRHAVVKLEVEDCKHG